MDGNSSREGAKKEFKPIELRTVGLLESLKKIMKPRHFLTILFLTSFSFHSSLAEEVTAEQAGLVTKKYLDGLHVEYDTTQYAYSHIHPQTRTIFVVIPADKRIVKISMDAKQDLLLSHPALFCKLMDMRADYVGSVEELDGSTYLELHSFIGEIIYHAIAYGHQYSMADGKLLSPRITGSEPK